MKNRGQLIKRFLFLSILSLLIFNYVSGEILSLIGKQISFYLDDRAFSFYAENPSPKNKKTALFLFKDFPPTSYIILIMNGKPYRLTEAGNLKLVKVFERNENSIEGIFKINEAIYTISFIITNMESKNNNAVLCMIAVTNEGNDSITVGARFLFDTMFGESLKKTSIYLSTKERIDYDRMFRKQSVPDFIFSGEYEMDNPNFGEGLFIYPSLNEGVKPDYVTIGNWKRFDETELDYPLEPRARFRYNIFSTPDAAVAIFYRNVVVKPKDRVSYGCILSANRIINPQVMESQKPSKAQNIESTNIVEKSSAGESNTLQQFSQPFNLGSGDIYLLKSQILLIEKMNQLIDRLDGMLSNKPADIEKESEIKKGMEKSVSKSIHGDPTGRRKETEEEKGKMDIYRDLRSYTFSTNLTEMDITNMKETLGKLQRQYDEKVAMLKEYYQNLIKKQEEEYKRLSGDFKKNVENKEEKKDKVKKVREMDKTLSEIERRINIIEELLKLNLNFESLPDDRLEEMADRINAIEKMMQ